MISLTTMTATSGLMHTHDEDVRPVQTDPRASRRALSVRDIVAVVILVLAFGGGIAAALSNPAPMPVKVVAARA